MSKITAGRALRALIAAITLTACTSGGSTSTDSPISSGDVRAMMRNALLLPGVSMTVPGEDACRCVIVGISDPSAESAVRKLADNLAIKQDAVRFKPFPQMVLDDTLQDQIRPIVGGIQIKNERGDICTMFGVVYHQGLGTKGLLTNSHCTAMPYAPDQPEGMEFFQAGRAWFSSDYVAREALDPMASARSSGATYPERDVLDLNSCPDDAVCRFSDAAFASFETSTIGQVGKVAQTQDRPCGAQSCGIDRAAFPYATLNVTGADMGQRPVGSKVWKVGRTTGWTYGTVSDTCADITAADVQVSGRRVVLLCQTLVRGAASGHGDSGAPVFDWAQANEVVYLGIHWSSGESDIHGHFSAYSPLRNIEADLGKLEYY